MIIRIIKKIFVVLIGAACLPLTITASRAFWAQLQGLTMLDSGNQIYFLWGVCSYVVMHLFFFKPQYIYNLGHEVVHVFSTWLSFGRAKNLKVSDQGGSVQTTKSNFFINISPYFIPIYTLLLCLAYFLLSKFGDVTNYAPYFIFFIGFTFTMHILLTAEALKAAQPDLIKTGYLFSLSLIYVINVMLAGWIIGMIFPGFSFVDMAVQFYNDSRGFYTAIYRQLFVV